MTTCRTISSSCYTDKTFSYSAYKSYKIFTFGNRALEKQYNPTNLLKQHYRGLQVNDKKTNRGTWLNKSTLESKDCKDIDKRMISRKVLPDKVGLVIEMNFGSDCSLMKLGKKSSRNTSRSINTERTINPSADKLSKTVNTIPKLGRSLELYKQDRQGSIKGVINQSGLKNTNEIGNFKRKKNPTFVSNGVFKLMKQPHKKEVFKENRLQIPVNLEKLRESRNFAGTYRPKNNFLEKNTFDSSNRSLLLKYTSSSVFIQDNIDRSERSQRRIIADKRNSSIDLSLNTRALSNNRPKSTLCL